jgi:pyrroline-5-carboxylate reductase
VKPIVFVGGGRITSALIAGLQLVKFGRRIVVHDRHAAKLQQLRRQYGITAEPDLRQAVDCAGLLIIAVRPDAVRPLLKAITPFARRRLTVVSLAAGVPLAKLRSAIPSLRWARAMPSPVCRSGRGLTALAFDRDVTPGARAEVRKLFSRVGQVIEIPEKRFDGFTVAYSSSHGYHALATLIAAAEAIGLDLRTARTAATHALADGIDAWRKGNVPLQELLQEAATPGGTAAAVMASLDRAGYKNILQQGLRAGIRQARKNAAR